MARSATAALLIGILVMLLWLPASGAHKLESLGPIRRIPGRPMKANPVVILFLHVPKCGGSTVRSIFKQNQWHMTHWSLTQRYEGSWHANRLLSGIRTQLAGNKSKIFVEWHLAVNFSFVPELERHIHRMRPGIRLIIFTILRQPNYLIRSAYAYFALNCPVTLAITLHPENFLFTTLNLTLPLQSTPPNGTSVCDWQPELRDVCEDAAIWQASFRLIKQNRRNQTWPFDGTSFDRSRVAIRSGQEVVLKGERRRANSIVERMVAIRQWSHRVGCATLVDDGLRMLAPIHHILYLESPDTFAIVHALARGNLSFTSPPQEERSQFGVSTFLDLHAHYDVVYGIGRRSWMRNRELYPTTESFHDVDGTPRRQSRTTACLGKIGTNSQTYTT